MTREELDAVRLRAVEARRTAMTNEELDILWFKAMRQSAEGDKALGHYHFAALVSAAERERLTKAAMSAAKIAIEEAMQLEREACAKVCEKMADNIYSNSNEDSQPMPHAVAKFCAAAIRARSEQEQPK